MLNTQSYLRDPHIAGSENGHIGTYRKGKIRKDGDSVCRCTLATAATPANMVMVKKMEYGLTISSFSIHETSFPPHHQNAVEPGSSIVVHI